MDGMMKTILLVTLLSMVGCSVSGGLYLGPDKWRVISIPYEWKGGETFCWEGVGWNDIGIGPVGWGTHECSRTSRVMRD